MIRSTTSRETFSIRNTTKGKPPRLPFSHMKEAVLGNAYELSLAFVSSNRSRTLNHLHRGKDTPANVLSFPLSPRSGEIIIDLKQAEKDAPQFDRSTRAFVAHLFIHGALHLKGFAHGSTMRKKEHAYCARFGFRA